MKNVDILKSMDVFAGVSDEDLHKISNLLKEKRVAKDAVIFRQGEVGDALYIVVSGRVKAATTDAGGREKVLGFIAEGGFFGEMALLTGEPRSATMQAMSDSRLLVLRKDDFESFLANNIQVTLQVMKVIAQRQAATNLRLTREQGEETAGATGNVFTVFSPKGGVGKSTIAVNLAVALAQTHAESVVLIDLSLTFGHATLMLNLVSKSSLSATTADALRKMDMAEGLAYYLAVHPSSSLRVLAGSMRPEEGEAVTAEIVKVAIEQLRRHFAYIVVDTSSSFTDPVLAALESSDKILMLCSPEISTLRDVRECQRIFKDVVRVPKGKVLYLMNNIFAFKALSKEQFESGVQEQIFMELPYGEDIAVKSSLQGEAFVETKPGSALAKSIQKLVTMLAVEKPKAGVGVGAYQDKKRGFFR